MNHNLQRNSQSSQSQTVSGLDRTLLDQPTYIEKLTTLVERAEKNAQLCAICGEPYGKHSGVPNFISGRVSCCPNGHGGYATLSTFKKYGECEGEITYNSDPTIGEPCRSSRGVWRPEFEQVLCDCCYGEIR